MQTVGKRRQPPASIAGKGKIIGDLIEPYISAKAYGMPMDKLEDAELVAIVESRKLQSEIDVAWDEL